MIHVLEQSVKYDATAMEKTWLTQLLSHNPDVICNAKRDIFGMDAPLAPDSPPVIHTFYGLIVLWLKSVRDRAELDGFGMVWPITKERYLKSYQDFLTEGFDWLDKHEKELRMVWPIFFSLQKAKGTIPRHWL
jgi:hypothetical protein